MLRVTSMVPSIFELRNGTFSDGTRLLEAYSVYDPTMSAVSEWRSQSEATCSSGAATKYADAGPVGDPCPGLVL